jgi:hypothetical protein
VFGSDLPTVKTMVKSLMIIGDGACPVCGSNNRNEITGRYHKPDFDLGGHEVLGWHCLNCQHDDYR